MKIVRAKNNKNKMKIFDNRPFAIDVELMKRGFKVDFFDLRSGEERTCYYNSRTAFDAEWELCGNVDGEDVIYDVINYYQE